MTAIQPAKARILRAAVLLILVALVLTGALYTRTRPAPSALIVTPGFKSTIQQYLATVERTHDAAAHGWTEFQQQLPAFQQANRNIRAAATDYAERKLGIQAYAGQIGYEDCVQAAIGPGTQYESLQECEIRSPISFVQQAVQNANAGHWQPPEQP